MTNISGFLVKYRKLIFITFLLVTILCGWLMTNVTVNSDMSKYLPDDSLAKTGIVIVNEEFPASSSFNLMTKGTDDTEEKHIYDSLIKIPHVSNVSYNPESTEYEGKNYTLFQVTLDVGAFSEEAEAVIDSVKNTCTNYDIDLSGEAAGNTISEILPKLVGFALIILLTILFIMCNSWIEPFLFLTAIAFAIVVNMGTNIVFENVSSITVSIAAILQLCLSIDYSIMLMNRYRQEKAKTADNKEAMKKALRGASVSISSSSVTTIVGMLALVFMSFTIGRDMGLVLAKGVFLSLLCMFTVLPALILMSDRLIERTSKKALPISMKFIAAGNYAGRFVIPILFIALFIGSFFLRGNVDIAYTMSDYYKVNKIFALNNPVVVLYEKQDADRIKTLVEKWEDEDGVTSVNAYSTTLGKEMTYTELSMATGIDEAHVAQMHYTWLDSQGVASDQSVPLGEFLAFMQNSIMTNPQASSLFGTEDAEQFELLLGSIDPPMMVQKFSAQELSAFLNMDENMVKQLYYSYYISNGEMPAGTIPMYDFLRFVSDDIAREPLFNPVLTDDMVTELDTAIADMDAGLTQLIGENYGRVIINTSLSEESETVYGLIDNLNQDIETFDGIAYITGSSAIAREMSKSFPDEMYRITILTIIAIFIIVALAFRSLTIPFILTCIIQCAVFITMGVAYLQGSSIYYLPLLIVQCLLLGATVDYAILFTSYYREARMSVSAKDAVIHAMQNSIHTILTSGLILVSITGVLGVLMKYSDPAISQILITVAVGGTCAMVLVIFVLPGIMAACDKIVVGKEKKQADSVIPIYKKSAMVPVEDEFEPFE